VATVFPFRGLRYNPEKVGDLSLVVTPPYDVISPEAQERYYQRHPYNVIRLILGKEFPNDGPGNNRYTRAAWDFQSWQEEGILIRDERPSIYIYEQAFALRDGQKRRRKGIIALVKLEGFAKGTVFPHEWTLSKPKWDRLELMRACYANFSPIFSFYSSGGKLIHQVLKDKMEGEPAIDLMDEDRIEHRLWLLQDLTLIQAVVKELADKQVFIADGHHRYETALAFRDELWVKDPADPDRKGQKAYNFVMMALVDMEDEGLAILPTHRMVRRLPALDKRALLTRVSPYFEVDVRPLRPGQEIEDLEVVLAEVRDRGQRGHVFGMYGGGQDFYLLTLRDERVLERLIQAPRSFAYKRLDVTILHSLIIEGLLGLGAEEAEREEKLHYTRDEVEAYLQVREGKYQLAFFLNPTKLEEVHQVASARERMPQKSTFFYPKLLTGLVINPIDPEETITL